MSTLLSLFSTNGCGEGVSPTLESGAESDAPAIGDSRLDPVLDDLPPGLFGELFFVEQRPQPYFRVVSLDLRSGEMRPVFTVEDGAFVLDIARSPDGGRLAMSYITSAEADEYDAAGLYLLDLFEGRAPEALVLPAADELLNTPVWRPDGDAIYFVRYTPAGVEPPVLIQRYDLAEDVTVDIAAYARSPSIAPDGQRLVYIALDPETGLGGLTLSDSSGGDVSVLVPAGDFHGIDLPHFDASGDWVYFSSLRATPTEELKHGGSHADVADWWRVPAAGGEPEPFLEAGHVIEDAVVDFATGAIFYSATTGLYISMLTDVEVGSQRVLESRAIRSLTGVWD